jgi:hypothetical protein
MLFVAVTTLTACALIVVNNYNLSQVPGKAVTAYANMAMTLVIMGCALVILYESLNRWFLILVQKKHPKALKKPVHPLPDIPDYGCC